MQSAQKFYSISEAARELSVSAETLRRWERSGKIKVGRTPTGNRIFSSEDILKLKEGFLNGFASQNDEKASHNDSINPQNNLTQPYTSLNKFKLSSKTLLFTALILISVLSTGTAIFTLFKFTPYPHQAVLGIETFVAPALE